MEAAIESRNRYHVNKELAALSAKYHDGLPVQQIDDILDAYDFKALEEGIYCGRDGRVHEQVGTRTWLSFSWHKMDQSGRYEVTAYVS